MIPAGLSPLTAARWQEREVRQATYADHATQRDWANPYVRFVCPACDETHDTRHDAENCCPPDVDLVYVHPVSGERFHSKVELLKALHGIDPSAPAACPVCGTECTDEHDASSCCLWHDFDAGTRYRIACRVERGTTWEEAIVAEVQGQ